MDTLSIHRLTPDDAAEYLRLRREALESEPLAFSASPEDDFVSSVDGLKEQLSREDAATIFGAFDGRLVGAVGLVRERRAKTAHKAILWGMYVTTSYRRKGIARRLVRAAVSHARTMTGVGCVVLSVSTKALEAKALYESEGFVSWGLEPDALRVANDSAGEYHMRLELEER